MAPAAPHKPGAGSCAGACHEAGRSQHPREQTSDQKGRAASCWSLASHKMQGVGLPEGTRHPGELPKARGRLLVFFLSPRAACSVRVRVFHGCRVAVTGRPDPGPAAVLVCDVLLITRCREAAGSEGSGVNRWKRVLVFPLAAARPCLSLPPLPSPGCGGAQGLGAAVGQPGLGQSAAE